MNIINGVRGLNRFNEMEGMIVEGLTERRVSRRGFLRGFRRGVGLAAVAGLGLTATGTAAAQTGHDDRKPGRYGLDLLRAWANNQIVFPGTPGQGWAYYAHPAAAIIFSYPADWGISQIVDQSPLELSDGNPAGVWVVAPDESAAFQVLVMSVQGSVSAQDAAVWKLQEVAGRGKIETIYDDVAQSGAIQGAFIGAEVDGMMAAVQAVTIPYPGSDSTFVSFKVAIGNAGVFDAATEQVFLPILGQFVGGGGTNDDDDDDGDDGDDGEPGDIINTGGDDDGEG
jgi:hypothetical protein